MVITISVVVQLRVPVRRYETVGELVIALIYGICSDSGNNDEEKRFKVANLHVGGLKVRSRRKRNEWLMDWERRQQQEKRQSMDCGRALIYCEAFPHG
ncbi:unnamed protein product [Camellia sinensis]